MATRARVVRMETAATTGGNALLVLVGLGVAFLLITALLAAAKSGGPLFNESNLLYVALIFYAGAGALYMGFGVTGWPWRTAGTWRDVHRSPAFTKCC